MILLFEVSKTTALETVAVSIPESVGLLAFGVGLVVIAIVLRTFFARSEKARYKESSRKKGLVFDR